MTQNIPENVTQNVTQNITQDMKAGALKKRALTGIKPTGTVHIGNYAGMLVPALDLSCQTAAFDVNIFIADYHALNNAEARKELGGMSLELAATCLALGFDTGACTFYRQSDVPETFELASFLSNFTPKGLMNRAHAYKAAVQDNAAEDPDIGINMGLYNYPILMAADILLFDVDVVPVGRDQRQHIEFARDIAGSVNAVYGEGTCKLPEAVMREEMMEVPGLDGRKMSKSYGNTLPLFAPADDIARLCKRIKTDSQPPEAPKGKDSLVYIFYRALATPSQLADFETRFLPGGMGYGTAKAELAELHEACFGKAREEYRRLLADPGHIDRILRAGAQKARALAHPVLARIRRRAGFSTHTAGA